MHIEEKVEIDDMPSVCKAKNIQGKRRSLVRQRAYVMFYGGYN